MNSRVYEVLRCADGSGGKNGTQVSQVSANKFMSLHSVSNGDYYLILSDGNLSRRDKDGEIDVEQRTKELWPVTQSKSTKPKNVEDPKTVGLKCYDIGYRYAFASTSSMKGKKVNPAENFSVPERCRNDSNTDKGIEDGAKAAF
ncbi:hypothetical protein ELE36_17995 [Pseudolysobacter antarcticus]|uniref:Uncharacterized protein n=1 Tax=Pseudolysobacter antarcticus TaxID=2511995 RepID=A0A411HNP9_9GAMM|nr:hypothetical protein [Pseudolysobacter antarcticus]QBB72107.1 hypothetical protein ELE36_17995 [Pseudolysobacter antarcticus]